MLAPKDPAACSSKASGPFFSISASLIPFGLRLPPVEHRLDDVRSQAGKGREPANIGEHAVLGPAVLPAHCDDRPRDQLGRPEQRPDLPEHKPLDRLAAMERTDLDSRSEWRQPLRRRQGDGICPMVELIKVRAAIDFRRQLDG